MTEKAGAKIQAVTGPIGPDQLGVTLTHEHLLFDATSVHGPPPEATAFGLYNAPASPETLGYIRHYHTPNADNYRLDDISTAIEEAALYKQNGGDTLVDATSIGIARDPEGLAGISRITGLNIIMGSSYYVAPSHPPDMASRNEDDIAAEIVSDITSGVGDSRIQAGIIGEVGCSWPLTDNERKVLRASGRAQQLTGAPLLIHPGRDERAPLEIIEILSEVGADLDNTVMGHLDRTVFLKDTLKLIAESGCFMEWDLFGKEASYYQLNPGIDMPGDAKRIDDISWVIAQGYGDKIVVAHDICTKDRLLKYGGHGYFYILREIVPRMRSRGIDDRAIDMILVKNPASVLTFASPASA